MTDTLIILDRQHVGQPIKRYSGSIGAGADIDGDGKKEVWEAEATWTSRYLFYMEQRLRLDDRYHIIPVSDGTYSQRHKRVNGYQDSLNYPNNVYIACHANAGGGNYGLWLYDSRSTTGQLLAKCIAEEVQKEFPGVRQITRAASKDSWSNAYYCIKGVKAVAICAEPWFLDNQDHISQYMNIKGMEKLGQAMVKGVEKWLKQK
jgi:N-acetylmuramoyl-L-alanine amidase